MGLLGRGSREDVIASPHRTERGRAILSPMDSDTTNRASGSPFLDLLRLGLVPAGLLAIVPELALAVATRGINERDADYASQIERFGGPADQRAAFGEFLKANPPSSTCDDDRAEVSAYRNSVCSRGSDLWQMVRARQVAFGALGLELAMLLCIALVGLLARLFPAWQLRAFQLGSHGLRLTSALLVVTEGALLVWFSFWAVALLFPVYAVKVVLLGAVILGAVPVGKGVLSLLKVLFTWLPPHEHEVEGETVTPEEAPALWARIREIAAKEGTAPPDHLIAGIDENFFVTGSPLTVQGRLLEGRTLFISLALLRLLDRAEAEAVIAHEMAHFGGDAAENAKLGPLLARYAAYARELEEDLLATLISMLKTLFIGAFELGRAESSRQREFRADGRAAAQVSGRAVSTSLIKVTAYSSYRALVEYEPMDAAPQHGKGPGLQHRIASGFASFVRTRKFARHVSTGDVPHPFDSHPALSERMARVGSAIPKREFAAIVEAGISDSWIDAISPAAAIEQRLWAAYEVHVNEFNARQLAFRQMFEEPEQPEEVALLFPPLTFALEKGGEARIDHEGFTHPALPEPAPWSRMRRVQKGEGSLSETLEFLVLHPETGIGEKRVLELGAFASGTSEAFVEVFTRYWSRRHAAAAWVAPQREKAAAEPGEPPPSAP